MQSLVSFICICYNHELYITSALDSVVNQTYMNIEIIIVDDFSEDNSVNIIKKWIKENGKGLLIQNQSNIGNVRSFNKAFAIATGEYIVDFATDDILFSNFALYHILNFEKSIYKNAGVSYCNVENVDANLDHIDYSFNLMNGNLLEGYIYEEVLKKYVINPVGVVMRRITLERMGGYDESLAFEDLNYLIVTARHYPIICLNEVLAQKRKLPNSMIEYFFSSFNKKSTELRNSTYKICKKAFLLNQSRSEDIALMYRIYTQIKLNIRNFQFVVLIKYLGLSSVMFFRYIFKIY